MKAIRSKDYKCDCGCEIDGCHGHTAILEFNTTANIYRFNNGAGKDMWFDQSAAQTLIDLFIDFSKTREDTINFKLITE
jgi:hypothetical protein